MILHILKNLQKEIVILLICIFIASIVVLFTYSLRQSAYEEKQLAESELKQARQQYYTAINQKLLLDKFESDYIKLQKAGIIDNEDRLNWVDNLESIAKQNKIPYLKYKIDKRQKTSSNALPQSYPGIDLYKSVMSLQMQLLHEGDLYTVLDSLNQKTSGLFDIQSCTLVRNPTQHESLISSDTDKNFNADCKLNWYTMQEMTIPLKQDEDI